MKRFFSTRVRVILLLAVLLTAVLLLIGSLSGENFAGKLVQGVLAPLRAGVKSLTTQAETLYSYMFRYEALEAENEALRAQIAEMEEDDRTSDALARENERLRSLLELSESREDFTFVDGYVIAWSSGDWTSAFTVNRGSDSGIQIGMCAVDGHGAVVGLVTEVGSNYAVIKSVLDSSLEISATTASGYKGMAKGAYTSGQEGLLRMDYLPSSAVIRNNDQVVTSGSTVYPRGLLLGYVVDAGYDDTGVAKFALLSPAADVDNLEQVFIITSYEVG